MRFGTLDLSIVTDHLIQMLRDCVEDSALWASEPSPEGVPIITDEHGEHEVDPSKKINITVTGNSPDIVQTTESGCLLSLYLFHFMPSAHQRNTPVYYEDDTGSIPERLQATRTPYQPFALDLYYVLSAFSKGRYIEEQQAMSIALKCFYENVFVKGVTLGTRSRPKAEFVLTLEPIPLEEMGRVWALWQAFTVPNRLSAIYKVSVVFLEPTVDPRAANPKPEVLSLTVGAGNRLLDTPQFFCTGRHIRFNGPNDISGDPAKRDIHDFESVPATVGPGQSCYLYGAGFSGAVTLSLFVPSQPAIDVTGWIDTGEAKTDSRVKITVPANPGVEAGLYQLTGIVGGVSTNSTALTISPIVDPVDPPKVNFTGPALSLKGAGFVPGKTEVLLGAIPLAEAGAGPGQFQVTSDTLIDFTPPANLTSGVYGVRVRVNGIEAVPALWVVIP